MLDKSRFSSYIIYRKLRDSLLLKKENENENSLLVN